MPRLIWSALLTAQPRLPPTLLNVQCASSDPFRSARPPIEPMIVNAVQDLLLKDVGCASQIAQRALEVLPCCTLPGGTMLAQPSMCLSGTCSRPRLFPHGRGGTVRAAGRCTHDI